MKKAITLILALALSAVFSTVGYAQAEKVKQKAKDLKKQVEGQKPATNSPPQKPKTPQR